jgi:hypothetical protein
MFPRFIFVKPDGILVWYPGESQRDDQALFVLPLLLSFYPHHQPFLPAILIMLKIRKKHMLYFTLKA